jgi:hypothetical protein
MRLQPRTLSTRWVVVNTKQTFSGRCFRHSYLPPTYLVIGIILEGRNGEIEYHDLTWLETPGVGVLVDDKNVDGAKALSPGSTAAQALPEA